MKVDMPRWSEGVQEDIKSIWTEIQTLCFNSADEFSADVLTDSHYATTGIFDQAENAAYLAPFQDALLQKLVRCNKGGKIVSPRRGLNKANAFLKDAEACRKSLLAAFIHSCDEPPENHQLFRMLYRQADGETNRWHRNLRRYQGTFLLGNPRANASSDPKSLDELAKYWPLQPELSWAFAYMFGVVRPVENRLISHFSSLPEEYETFMFVKALSLTGTSPRKNWLYGVRNGDMDLILKRSHINASFALVKAVHEAIRDKIAPDDGKSKISRLF